MKKSVIIAILVIYLGSIVLVNFFGLKVKNFEGTKYVENITCAVVHRGDDDKEVKVVEDPTNPQVKWHIFDFIPGSYSVDELEENPNVVQIDFHVYPENADNRKVRLVYDEATAASVCVINENNMTVVFLQPMGITIEVVAADGSNIKETMFIYPLMQV